VVEADAAAASGYSNSLEAGWFETNRAHILDLLSGASRSNMDLAFFISHSTVRFKPASFQRVGDETRFIESSWFSG
jgi:hypothetical protein